MKERIAIIGANEQQNPLILKAKEMGYETHTFAWQTGGEIGELTSDYFYPISAGNREDILAKCKEIGIAAVTSVGSDMAAVSAAYVAATLGLTGNGTAAVMRATNKVATRDCLAEKGISQPRYVAIGDTIPFDGLNALRYPLVVKPSDRSGGRGIRLVERESELFAAINHARELSFERKAIVEEYIEGRLYSCECLSLNGAHRVIGFTGREVLRVDGRFCEYKHTQPALLALSVEKKMESECERILQALEFQNGASSIEFILDERKNVYIIEVTPTMYGDYIGTDLVPQVYGLDYTRAVIDIACGKAPELPACVAQKRGSVKFFYSREDGVENAPAVPDGRRYGHCVTVEPFPELGGCLPLSLPTGSPYFTAGESVLALNSEYTAFWYALKHMGVACVHVPYYASSAFSRIAGESDVECKYYRIDGNFLPVDLQVDDGEAVLLINYHGLCAQYIRDSLIAKKIVDNSMAFYCPPLMEEGTYNIYSPRKFFAVSDGAYLVSASLCGVKTELERDVSYKRAGALLRSLELGGGATYKDWQTNEQALVKQRGEMSLLTERMLSAIDYKQERATRERNFRELHERLKEYNRLSVDREEGTVPQFYPLLVEADIRSSLIEKKIYIPLMWRKTMSAQFDGTAEKAFSERLLCLPIDPMYSVADMEYLAEVILAALS